MSVVVIQIIHFTEWLFVCKLSSMRHLTVFFCSGESSIQTRENDWISNKCSDCSVDNSGGDGGLAEFTPVW